MDWNLARNLPAMPGAVFPCAFVECGRARYWVSCLNAGNTGTRQVVAETGRRTLRLGQSIADGVSYIPVIRQENSRFVPKPSFSDCCLFCRSEHESEATSSVLVGISC